MLSNLAMWFDLITVRYRFYYNFMLSGRSWAPVNGNLLSRILSSWFFRNQKFRTSSLKPMDSCFHHQQTLLVEDFACTKLEFHNVSFAKSSTENPGCSPNDKKPENR